ncbi:MAG: PD-(D/E)XK nuclease family protein [Candidatus Portnoybacteria bacterium]|nr:PD-(D/E)XK nuclease family protein [Candidatus Portnoybacteria bacterium]
MRLSYSQLEWFLRCPYVYRYQYIDKHTFPKGKEAVFGGLLHEVLEYIYRERPLIPTLSEILAFYEREWERRSVTSYFPTPLQGDVHFKEGLRVIKSYAGANDLAGADILALEQFFEIPLKDPLSGETHLITGRIDRIDKHAGEIEVIDYKTSRILKTQNQIAKDLQLSLYHLGVFQLWPELVKKYSNNVSVSLYFLRHGEKISAKKTAQELKETKENLLTYIRQIQDAMRNDAFEARPSSLCALEPYSHICPFFKDKHRSQKPKIANQKEVSEVIHEYLELKEKDKAIKTRLAQLNELIHPYLDEQTLEAIYDGDAGIIRSHSPLYELDVQILKELLFPLGKWDDILEVSKSKLKKFSSELPQELREKIKQAQKVKGMSKSLRIKRL